MPNTIFTKKKGKKSTKEGGKRFMTGSDSITQNKCLWFKEERQLFLPLKEFSCENTVSCEIPHAVFPAKQKSSAVPTWIHTL